MTVTYLSRADWGGGPLRSGHVVPQTQFNGIVAHHTVIVMPDYDGDGFLDGDLDDICRYMRQLQHARPDLGDEVPYSFVHFFGAKRDDTVVAEGRGFGVTGAHTIGYNSSRYGCAFAGNSIDQTVTDGVMSGYRYIGRQLDNPYHAAATIGHRDVYATACPGTSLYLRLSEIQPPFTEPAPIPPPAPTEELVTYTYVQKPGDTKVYVARHGEPATHVGDASFGFKDAEAMIRYQGDKLVIAGDGTVDVVDAQGETRKVLVLNSAGSQAWFGI